MIELIFVIVIIGILAAVAVPRLAATRDDAEVSRALADLSTCIKDIGALATAVRDASTINVDSQDQAVNSSSACAIVQREGVFALEWNDDDRILTVSDGASVASWAKEARDIANDNGLVREHQFGGSRIVR